MLSIYSYTYITTPFILLEVASSYSYNYCIFKDELATGYSVRPTALFTEWTSKSIAL